MGGGTQIHVIECAHKQEKRTQTHKKRTQFCKIFDASKPFFSVGILFSFFFYIILPFSIFPLQGVSQETSVAGSEQNLNEYKRQCYTESSPDFKRFSSLSLSVSLSPCLSVCLAYACKK